MIWYGSYSSDVVSSAAATSVEASAVAVSVVVSAGCWESVDAGASVWGPHPAMLVSIAAAAIAAVAFVVRDFLIL